MFNRFGDHRAMICGVCAWMADRWGFPLWIIRVVALVLLIAHAPLMAIGYVVAALLIRQEARNSGLAGPDRLDQLDRRMRAAEEAAYRRTL